MQLISYFEKVSRLKPKNFAFRINRKTDLNRFNLIPEIEMFSHSTQIIPRGSFWVAWKKIGGSFGVGDNFASCPYPMTFSGGLLEVAVTTNVPKENRLKRIGEIMQDSGQE